MNPSDILNLLIGVLIVGAVLFTVLRYGRANPIGTADLQDKITEAIRPIRHKQNNLDMKFSGVEAQLAKMPTSETLMEFEREIEGRMATVEAQIAASATGEDLEKLRGEVGKVQTAIEHVCKQNDRTEDKIDRIEAILMKDALKR